MTYRDGALAYLPIVSSFPRYDGMFPLYSVASIGVESAIAVDQDTIRITYSGEVKHVDAGNSDDSLNPANYDFVGDVELTPESVTLIAANPTVVDVNITNEQTGGEDYSVVVSNVLTLLDEVLSRSTASFPGFGVNPQVASIEVLSPFRIRLFFNEPMTFDGELDDPDNYAFDGPTVLTPTTVTPFNIGGVTRVDIDFTGIVENGGLYEVEVSSVSDLALNVIDWDHDIGTFLGETQRARISSILATISTKVRVTYDSEMKHSNPGNSDDVLHSTNYVFSGGSVPLIATEVELVQANPTIVDVVVNEQTNGESYHLKVNNVEDVETERTLDTVYDEYDFSGIGDLPTVQETAEDSASDWVKIRFSELMGDSALTKENYEIYPPLYVLGVQKITDYVYKVTTESQLPGLDYRLILSSSIKDLGGNEIDPAHDEVAFRGKYSNVLPYDYFSSSGGTKRVGPVDGAGVVIVEVSSDKSE